MSTLSTSSTQYPKGLTVNFRNMKVNTLKRIARHFTIDLPEDVNTFDYAAAVAQ
jgi:hypothetical protein